MEDGSSHGHNNVADNAGHGSSRFAIGVIYYNEIMLSNTRKSFAVFLFGAALSAGALLVASGVAHAETSGKKHHAIALHGTPKYKAGFKRFSYVNPRAPKRGELVRGGFGTFDSLNPFILQGNAASGIGTIYDTLTFHGAEEPFTEYGLLAESIELPPGKPGWIIYNLHKSAKFSDGKPVTADDVVFSFNIFITKALPLYRAYYSDVAKAEALGKHRVKFTFKHSDNRELPLILGQLAILPKHYWEGKDFSKPSLDVPIGSGPYMVDEIKAGRSITYKLNPDYWGKDLNVNVGRNNFAKVRYIYYRDLTIMHEAFKAGEIQLKTENQASRWKQGYNFAAVTKGDVIKKGFTHGRNAGMQGFAMNTRRDVFKDARVRRALNYAFDFEWANKNLFFGTYTRSPSFFSNSELAASGKPGQDERRILEKYRGKLPEAVWEAVEPQPRTDTSDGIRSNLRTAINLLKDAGWELKDGKLRNKDSGKQMKFEILLVQKAFERIVNPFAENLRRLGVDVAVRLVDTTQYINRAQSFDFDMIVMSFAQSESPGNEQRNFWGSKAADAPGSRNFIGIKNPVIDEIIEQLIMVESREDLVAYCRVLDRILLAGHYIIPNWYIATDRVAYWNNLAHPAKSPSSGVDFTSWWAKK